MLSCSSTPGANCLITLSSLACRIKLGGVGSGQVHLGTVLYFGIKQRFCPVGAAGTSTLAFSPTVLRTRPFGPRKPCKEL